MNTNATAVDTRRDPQIVARIVCGAAGLVVGVAFQRTTLGIAAGLVTAELVAGILERKARPRVGATRMILASLALIAMAVVTSLEVR